MILKQLNMVDDMSVFVLSANDKNKANNKSWEGMCQTIKNNLTIENFHLKMYLNKKIKAVEGNLQSEITKVNKEMSLLKDEICSTKDVLLDEIRKI